MVAAILLGREGSVGFPCKNRSHVLERPLMAYPLLSAKNSKLIDKIYVSTDSTKMKDIANNYWLKQHGFSESMTPYEEE